MVNFEFDYDENLCCNYIAWNDSSYTCDLMRGDTIVRKMDEEKQISSSAMVFNLKSRDNDLSFKQN